MHLSMSSSYAARTASRILATRMVGYLIVVPLVAMWAAATGDIAYGLVAAGGVAALIAQRFVKGDPAHRLEFALLVDTGGLAVVWWLIGTTPLLDLLIFYIAAAASLALPKQRLYRVMGGIAAALLLNGAAHVLDQSMALPLFHVHEGGLAAALGEVGFRFVTAGVAAALFAGVRSRLDESDRAIRASEERYRSLVEMSPDAIVVHNGGTLLYANPAAAELVGAASPDDLIGLSPAQFIHPDFAEQVADRMRASLGGEVLAPADAMFLDLEGNPIPVQTVAGPATFGGKPAAQVTIRDTTVLAEMRKALEASERRFRNLFQRIPTALYRSTPEGKILYANPALVELLGYPDEETLLAIDVRQAFVEPHERDESLELAADSGVVIGHEQQMVRFDGTKIWVRDSMRVVEEDGQVILEGAMTDITAEKAAEAATKRLTSILEATSDLVILFDIDGSITWANGAATHWAQVDAPTGLSIFDLLDPDAQSIQVIFDALRRHGLWSGVITLRNRDGGATPASAVVIAHFDRPDHISHLSAIVRDISDRIAVERRLQDLVKSKDEFVASVSHELRTPLTAVVGLSTELLHRWKEFGEEEIAEFTATIAGQSREVADIVEDLLVAARADIGKVSVYPDTVDVPAEIEAVLEVFPEDVVERVDVAGTPTWAWADAKRLRQIVRNLITNAVRYGGDHIEVRYGQENGTVEVAVADDGDGIAPEFEEIVFEPYGRAKQDTAQPGSVGLGLSVSRHLARLMGGDLVYRHDGDKAYFELQVPAAKR